MKKAQSKPMNNEFWYLIMRLKSEKKFPIR